MSTIQVSASLLLILLINNILPVQSFIAMAWKDTWADILDGGPKRWKVDDRAAKETALNHIQQHTSIDGPMRILCPLAGDDPFVYYAWSQGHDVTAIDIVPAALEELRNQFGKDSKDWSSEHVGDVPSNSGNGLVWKHKSGRATLIEGDVLTKRRELNQSFDVIYDKDSFGALEMNMRKSFCDRLSEFAKDGCTLYIEVKNKGHGRENGPPYHVEKKDLVAPDNFGTNFEHVVSLGEVYQLQMPGMKQTGHVLRRVLRR